MIGNLTDVFYYDETSKSCLRWKIDSYNCSSKVIVKNSEAGCLNNRGYYVVFYKYKSYTLHRLVWQLLNGEIPEGKMIDHIDGNKTNNKIENLRCVSRTINARNKSIPHTNKTGVHGIIYRENWNTFVVRLRFDDISIHKTFSVKKYGEKAFELAKQFRIDQLRILNEKGFQISERHIADHS